MTTSGFPHLSLVVAAGLALSAATPGHAQIRLEAPPDSAVLYAIRGLRSADPVNWGMARSTIRQLRENGHLREGSARLQLLVDSLLAIAGTHEDTFGRGQVFGVMRSLDSAGVLFPVATWANLIERQPTGALRLTLLGILAEHPDSANAARAIAEAAERRGNTHLDVDAAIDYLLRMDSEHGRAALAALRRSPRVTDPASVRRLERLERTGFRDGVR